VEMIYTKFVSLISSEPTVQTLLPLTPQVIMAALHAA
jgi:F-type H+-transporting ATPase subunit gamma